MDSGSLTPEPVLSHTARAGRGHRLGLGAEEKGRVAQTRKGRESGGKAGGRIYENPFFHLDLRGPGFWLHH